MAACTMQVVRRVCGPLGFALVGVTPARPTRFAGYIRRWLGQGRHGQMDYLARNLGPRLDPRTLLPGARAVVCVADRYPACVPDDRSPSDLPGGARQGGLPGPPVRSDHRSDQSGPRGRIARYAWGNDYHRVIKKRLFRLADTLRTHWPEHRFKVTVDTAPILEREHAARAGLGWVGKHTLLIHPQQGSWLLLGEIVTTLPIETHDDADATPMADHCGTCTRCIDACPTGCISPYQLDARRCISYLTIEHRGPIEPAMHGAMGSWVAGCDVCQEVCPFNQGRFARPSDQPDPAPGHDRYAVRRPGPDVALSEILNWDVPARQEVLRKSALKRIKLEMFKRNALIAAGNALLVRADPALLLRIRQLASDAGESELVRTTAAQVLKRVEFEGGPKRTGPTGSQAPTPMSHSRVKAPGG